MKLHIYASKRFVKSPIDRLRSMIGGVSEWGNGPKLHEVHLSDYGSTSKWNYCISDRYWDLTPSQIEEFTATLKRIGAKYITKRRGALYFYYDLSKLDAEYQAEKQAAEDDYAAELNAMDIDQYKPTPAIIKKLIDYRDKGSKVNVKAIKDINKLLTYYYGANLIGWYDLAGDIYQLLLFKSEYSDILEAINRRVTEDPQYADRRTEMDKKLDLPDSHGLFTFESRDCWLPKSILMYFLDNDIPVHFKKRTGGSQYDYHGAQWTEIEHLVIFPDSEDPIDYDIAVHTSEGGGASRYTGEGTGIRTSARNIIEDIDRKIRQHSY